MTSSMMAGRKRKATMSTASRRNVPDVYSEMLAEAGARTRSRPDDTTERPAKRKRPGQRDAPKSETLQPGTDRSASLETGETGVHEDEDVEFENVELPQPTVQTLYRDSDEEDEDEGEEEELEFENVDFSFPDLHGNKVEEEEEPSREIRIDTTTTTPLKRSLDRRKPLNRSEKDRRLEIHKMHVLCLLSHVALRNHWCNDEAVQEILHELLTPKTAKYLIPGKNLSQFGQTESLKNGLQQLEATFKTKFSVTERGLHRALWAEKEEHLKYYKLPDDIETVPELSDFRSAAKKLEGSRDVGAQLYCALLRTAGVEARLVCSLQPLSLASGGPSMPKAPKPKPNNSSVEQAPPQSRPDESPFPTGTIPPPRQRLGGLNATAFHVPKPTPPPPARTVPILSKKIRESPFPIYWVEVLDEAHQKWQPADPLVTQSFWKPKVLEPPANDHENCMTYVVAFEADGTVIDVTRRYAKAYNAKTRRLRVETAAANGARWWRRALRKYSRGYTSDLDQIESNELSALEAREPMPRNVADFKDHPIYALERHLRRNEVLILGATSSGTISASKGASGPLERIYRRRDVRIARTRERWYRMGREVLGDQIPVKWLPKRTRKQSDLLSGDEDEGDAAAAAAAGTPVFTEEQTLLYRPPAIVGGVIPKNRFGNIEVYVPSMVPEGGVYIAADLAARAARVLGIDFAAALTGFQFQGRKGTAVLHGAVVPAECEDAVRAVMEGLVDQEAEAEREKRSRAALRLWKRLLMNLRVRQRIWDGVDEEAEAKAEAERQAVVVVDSEDVMEEEDRDGNGGAGEVDSEEEDEDEEEEDDDGGGGGFVIEDDDMAGGF